MSGLVLEADDRRWDALLRRAPHDVFHTAGFHRFAAAAEGGRARMIFLGDADRGIAWPYVLRPVDRVTGLERLNAHDIGATFGYSGPLTWGVAPGDPWLTMAWETIRRHWQGQRVVSVFTRFHPMLENAAAAEPFTSTGPTPAIVPAGLMVSVDCTLDEARASADLPRVLRQEVAAARRAGLSTREDEAWRATETFVELHRETMARNGASDLSHISPGEVLRLRDELEGSLHLMTTTMDGSIVAAGLFSEYDGIVQALLVGIDHTQRRWSPLKVMLDDVRRWAHARGDRVLHLGGGRGGRPDSLYEFKGRFSRRRHRSFIGRWILDPLVYLELTARREENLRGSDLVAATSDWFPAYRAPLVMRQPVGIPDRRPAGAGLRRPPVALPVEGKAPRPAPIAGGRTVPRD